jgi:mRNA interferase RelE/StbE
VASAAEREIRKLDPRIRKQLSRDILSLEDNPRPPGVEKLKTKEKLYRIHVGPGKNYRAIYQIRDEILLVLVVKVGNRKDVYRRLE